VRGRSPGDGLPSASYETSTEDVKEALAEALAHHAKFVVEELIE